MTKKQKLLEAAAILRNIKRELDNVRSVLPAAFKNDKELGLLVLRLADQEHRFRQIAHNEKTLPARKAAKRAAISERV